MNPFWGALADALAVLLWPRPFFFWLCYRCYRCGSRCVRVLHGRAVHRYCPHCDPPVEVAHRPYDIKVSR